MQCIQFICTLLVDGVLKEDFPLQLTNDAFYPPNHKTHFSFALGMWPIPDKNERSVKEHAMIPISCEVKCLLKCSIGSYNVTYGCLDGCLFDC